jgi:aerobic carbon-monoxide dehydrogenase small subunit
MTARKHSIEVAINGRTIQREVESRLLLSDFLRSELRMTGTHVGCEHGVCGACTISINGSTARSCLTFAVQMHGAVIETVESLARHGPLSVIQQAFHEHHALQCGFCTPGFLMSTRELLAHDPDPSEEAIRTALSGHICRCTGYVHIVRAVRAAARKLAEGISDGD